jgi:hypothetical protein
MVAPWHRTAEMYFGAWYRKVDIRLHGKANSKLPWRKADQPVHLVDVEDADL